jgi:molybdopterin-containing oxidoreductase family iron-sulfur binding subunit
VSKLKARQHDYSVLEFLETKPRTTYLARLRNPNPEMPDYLEWPFTFEEYKARNGDPFDHHGAPEGHAGNDHANESKKGAQH